MAEKMSTLVLKVDLECSKCYNKVRRTLCQYHYEIRSQTIDKKQGTITISGPFDPESFAKKLKSKTGKALKGIDIKKKEEEKPKKEEEKPKDPPKKADAKSDPPKQADAKSDKPKQADAKSDKPKEAEKPKKVSFEEPKGADPPKAAPAPAAQPGPEMKFVEPGTVLAYPIIQPYGAYSVPCYEGYLNGGPVYDGYGRPIGYNNGYGDNRVYGNGGGYNSNHYNNNNNYGSDYFTEKDPNCSIM